MALVVPRFGFADAVLRVVGAGPSLVRAVLGFVAARMCDVASWATASLHPLKLDCVLGTRGDALAARLAGGGERCVGRLPSVDDALQLAEDAELREVAVVDSPDFEHVERAHVDARGLALATRAVDDRHERSGLGAARTPSLLR